MKNIFQKNKNNIYHKDTSVFLSLFTCKGYKLQKGFTLVELMVVVAIIAVISALSLFSSSNLNSAVLISNTAYEIGLVIRDAQVSGLGAKVISDANKFATTSNQGIYFSVDNVDNSDASKKIIIFSDITKDNIYSVGEESQIYNIENKRAGTVTKICQINSVTNECEQLTELTIMFKRPNPEAYFYPSTHSSEPHTGTGYNGTVAINVGFEGGDCRSIIIYKTGAIQIDRSYCSPVTN